MSKIIIISGDLTAGKSALAKKLSRHLQVPYFTKSRFKEILGEKIAFEGIDQNKKISKSSYELLMHVARRFVNVGQSVILEANFHTKELEQLKKDIEFYNQKVVLLYLTGDIDALYERFKYREHYENRHPVHLTHPIKDLEEFEEYILRYRAEKQVLPRQMIDTTNCDDEMIFAKALEILGGLV